MNSFIHKINVDLGRPVANINMFDKGPDIFEATSEVVPSSHTFDHDITYKMKLEFVNIVECKPEMKDHMLDNFVKQIRHTLYSDFISDILRLEQAIYEGKEGEAHSAIRDLWTLVQGI